MACGLIYTAAYSFIKQKSGVNVWTMTTSEHIHYLMGAKLMLFRHGDCNRSSETGLSEIRNADYESGSICYQYIDWHYSRYHAQL